MPEDQSAAFCEEVIYSEDYRDYIKEYFQDFSSIIGTYQPVCIEAIGSRYAVMHLAGETSMQRILENYNISMIPALYGLVNTASLEDTGILYIHRNPYLDLRGSGVMIGIIDTGIDYTHPAFVYEDRSTKIYAIWDQTIREGQKPEGFQYGTEYTRERIDQALKTEHPLEVVPSVDENGHGTFIAGASAGRAIEAESFSGAAPNASLCVVKLKPCKQYLRQFYGFSTDALAYQENDIMAGISYCIGKARQAEMPLIILLGIGTSSGGHTGQSYLSQMVNDVSGFSGVCVVTAVGNESNTRHHFAGILPQGQDRAEAEIRVDEKEKAFSIELWAQHPDIYNIGIESPAGERIDRVTPAGGKSQTIRLIFDQTEIFVYNQQVESQSGQQMIFLRFRAPTAGIWTLSVYGAVAVNRHFHIWLPMQQFISDGTYFLRPDPDVTLSDAACADDGISVGAYNNVNNSLYAASGRGFTADNRIKPDLTAPGVNLSGPLPGGRYGMRTGTSVSAALTAGAAALLMEWGLLKGNDLQLNSHKMIKYLTLGALRREDLVYPDKAWGYGRLNLLKTFQELMTGRR